MTKSKKVLGILVLLLLTSSVLFAQAGRVYKVGDTGPAGGKIFYDRGEVHPTDGWRYLEVSPLGGEKKVAWSPRNLEVKGTGASVGDGKKNTQLMLEAIAAAKGNVTDTAAQICAEYEVNGFKDWFLPSLDEVNHIFSNRDSLGGFQNGNYWSSTQNNKKSAKSVEFSLIIHPFGFIMPGSVGDNNKFDERLVRPIRAF